MVRDPSRLARKARHQRFHAVVTEVMEGLPGKVSALLENVAIVVEDEPSAEHQGDAGIDDPDELLGLYQGIPRTERDSGYSLVAPDRITLFAGPLARACSTREEIREQIRITILHELGHHLGFDEGGLDSLGLT